MGSETNLARSVLTVEEVAFFRENGYVRVKQALPRELALEMQRQIWAEFAADHGIERENRSTWRPPPSQSAARQALRTQREARDRTVPGRDQRLSRLRQLGTSRLLGRVQRDLSGP